MAEKNILMQRKSPMGPMIFIIQKPGRRMEPPSMIIFVTIHPGALCGGERNGE